MLAYQPQKLLNIKYDVPQLQFKHLCEGQQSKKGSYVQIL